MPRFASTFEPPWASKPYGDTNGALSIVQVTEPVLATLKRCTIVPAAPCWVSAETFVCEVLHGCRVSVRWTVGGVVRIGLPVDVAGAGGFGFDGAEGDAVTVTTWPRPVLAVLLWLHAASAIASAAHPAKPRILLSTA